MVRSNGPKLFLLNSGHFTLVRKYSSPVKSKDTKYDIPPFESDSLGKDRTINPVSEKTFKHTSKTELRMESDIETEKENKKCGHIGEISFHNHEFRCNELNIQMLSRSLFNQLFSNTNYDSKPIGLALQELRKHGLPGPLSKVPDIDLKLPPLVGENIEEHFFAIGEEQCSPYRNLVSELLNDLEPITKEWEFKTGWTKYERDKPPLSVEYPDEDALLFDVEVCRSHGEMPIIATAASKNAWYSWVSKDLIEDNSKVGNHHYVTDDLIPMQPKKGDGFKKPKIIVGHAVSYDRARIREQYLLDRSGMRFIDTMSLHICISGITSYQKSVLKSKSEDKTEDEWCKYTSLNSLSDVYKLYYGSSLPKEEREIFIEGTLKEIKEKFQSLMTYCARDVIATHKILKHLWPSFLERFPHPVTLAGMLELSTCYLPVNNNWKRFTEHCKQGYEDLDIESKIILSQQADKACQLLHDDKYKEDLWLWDRDWSVKQLKLKKTKTSKKSLKEKLEREETQKNTQNELMDQETEDIFDNHKKLHNKFASLEATCERLPKRIPYLAGYPEWYRKLCLPPSSENWRPGPQLISTSMQIAPKLLSLMWKSMPLHYVRGKGWGQLVPHQTSDPLPDDEMSKVPLQKLKELYFERNESRIKLEANVALDEGSLHDKVQLDMSCELKKKRGNRDYLYRKEKVNLGTANFGVTCGISRLPHKDGDHLNVGNPLSRDFINKFSDAGLSGNNEKTGRVIEISRMLSYWKNNRERIENQLVVWLSNKELPRSINNENGYGAILPQVAVCGTLTRRAVERTWMTASNATDERVGSELRSMIQAPDGYSLVGADVDSQELWIASLIGDAHFTKDHGCTAFGWMTLSGQKSDGTDMHSMTAKTMGISRSHAKIINYARIYGAGQPFAQRLLKQFIPEISVFEARQKAFKMFESTKGRRVYQLKPNALPEVVEREYEKGKVKQICEVYGKSVDELFESPKWKGGSESAMFNRLEEIAYSSEPATPFLRGRLSRALESSVHECDSKLVPTRINWVVQSGAVDFLHLMLVCMKWLIHPQVRFCISFHDEVRYLSPDKYKYQTALALHVTNLLTRTFCVRRLGMIDLPQSVAFFTSVEVDTVLRKEANNDCITPSNPHGLSRGYGIPLGESLDITNAILKADGIIGNRKASKKSKEKENVNQYKKEICDK